VINTRFLGEEQAEARIPMGARLVVEIGQSITSRKTVFYKNVQHLGSGANSVVQLVLALNGEHRGLLFALRVFTQLGKPDRLERFRREMEFLYKCSHPSIMRIYDDGVYPVRDKDRTVELPFVVAEYLPKTLADVLRVGTTTAERVSYTLQLLSALEFLALHTPAVVHRDIKPQNIFVKGRSCVLGDFGLLKFIDDDEGTDRELFKESVGPGMPRYYRTPDLVAYAKQENALTAKSDVFQLGLVVAEMFCGRNPLHRSGDLLGNVVLDPLGEIPGTLNMGIRGLIERMLEFDSDRRPAAGELIDQWEGVFREVVKHCHLLDGRVF
jgi:serine/threonine protein kinase